MVESKERELIPHLGLWVDCTALIEKRNMDLSNKTALFSV